MRAELKPLWVAAMGTGALTVGLALPSTAGAYATPQCHGTSAAGVGASLQKDAQLGINGLANTNGWDHTFSTLSNSVCPAGGVFDGAPTYNPLGSGAGNAVMCADGKNLSYNNGGTLVTSDFGAADDPPTTAQIANMNNCAAAVSPGSTFIHTIPVLQAAIAIAVHLPAGCTINSADYASTGDRFAILNADLEKAFLGDGSVTWATLLPNSPGCSGPIKRVVRYDESGTTFQTANYLAQINDQSTWQNLANSSLQFQNWPNNTAGNIIYGGTTRNSGACPLSGPNSTPPDPNNSGQTQPSSRSLCNGAGNVVNAVIDTPGSIGYADMSTQISKGLQYTAGASTFWVPVQNNGTGTKGATFTDPNANSNGYISGNATGGANCASATYTPPSGASDPTTVSWSGVIGSNPSTTDYPLCTLSYELLWDDAADVYGNTPAIDARQRTVKDFITYLTDNTSANDGQNVLRSLNYDALPSNILSVAQSAAGDIHFP